MGWRSSEVGLNLGGGFKIVNHLMLSCYYNIGLDAVGQAPYWRKQARCYDQIFDGDILVTKQVLAPVISLLVLKAFFFSENIKACCLKHRNIILGLSRRFV